MNLLLVIAEKIRELRGQKVNVLNQLSETSGRISYFSFSHE